jgi:two-component system chemotaxis response regulator CheY
MESKMDVSHKISNEIDSKNIMLVVDDDCTIFSLQKLLRHQGYNVTIARNIKKAVIFYKANQKAIDLILMDISTPIIDGIEAHSELTQFDPNVSILIMSSYTQDSLGVFEDDKFIRKPFYSSELFKSIVNIFDPAYCNE